MRALWLLSILLVSCMQMPTSFTDEVGAAGSDGADASEPAEVTGSDCVTDAQSRVTLCTSISSCDGLAVDHDAYPDCGFRVGGSNIDLECFCGDYLCPMGTSLSCAQARELLADSNELAVCAQQGEGRCALRATTEPARDSSCDRSCAQECVNSPACLELCGC
ncbi:MAG: hypothetical protein JW940_01055 [Polyangiaceae bacterium]|nr:hypothetical protein [Polyangiaceae bacterium]